MPSLKTPKKGAMSSSLRTSQKKKQTIPDSEDLFCSEDDSLDQILSTGARREKERNVLKDKSFFGKTVSKAGFVLTKGNNPNILSEFWLKLSALT